MPRVPALVHCGIVAVLLAGLGGSPSASRAQPAPDTTRAAPADLIQRLEPALDALGTTDQTTTQAAEQFADLRARPLDLNRVSAADLSVLPGVSLGDAHRIIRWRETNGPFDSLRSLGRVAGISPKTIRSISPFLEVGPRSPSRIFPSFSTITSDLSFSLTQRYGRRLDLGRGYREGQFLGPPGRLTTRLRLDHDRRLQLALTLDKDPGEPVQWAPARDTYGFDHVAGSLALRDIGPVETLVLGDFTAQFGQGVAVWQGLRFGKGRDPVAPAQKSGRGVQPYRSASEANFFRGIAATIAVSDAFTVTTFASRRNRDASIDSSLSSPPFPARTISEGGYHRTRSELARKGTFGETTLGGAVEYRGHGLQIGATGYLARFNRALRPGDRPHRRFRVNGRHTSAIATYATLYVEDYTLFGEVARTPNAVYGGLLGAALDGRYAEAVLLGRYYPAAFGPFYGNAFADGGHTQNELGIYTGLDVEVTPSWTIGAYFDQFRAPWLQFNVPRPSTGWEARVVLEYEPRPWLSMYIQGRAQGEDVGTEYEIEGRRLEGLHRERRYSGRGHLEYAFSDALTLRTRLELSRQTTPQALHHGLMLAQGLRWRPHPSLTLDARIAFFETDGYAARIYAYEHDLRYSFSAPVFFDQGRRSYLLVQYEPIPSLTLEAKYGVTTHVDRSTIGSGLSEIDGDRRREIRMQIQWTL